MCWEGKRWFEKLSLLHCSFYCSTPKLVLVGLRTKLGQIFFTNMSCSENCNAEGKLKQYGSLVINWHSLYSQVWRGWCSRCSLVHHYYDVVEVVNLVKRNDGWWGQDVTRITRSAHLWTWRTAGTWRRWGWSRGSCRSGWTRSGKSAAFPRLPLRCRSCKPCNQWFVNYQNPRLNFFSSLKTLGLPCQTKRPPRTLARACHSKTPGCTFFTSLFWFCFTDHWF